MIDIDYSRFGASGAEVNRPEPRTLCDSRSRIIDSLHDQQLYISSLQPNHIMPSYTEEEMADAIFDVIDNGLSRRQSATKNGIPLMTLSDRMKGIVSKSEAIHPSQRLSDAEENRVVDWILKQESLGYAPTALVVRKVVESILKKKGDLKPLGKNWLEGFKTRHDRVHTKIGRAQEAARFDGFTPKAVD